MQKTIVILGGGTGGIVSANILRKKLKKNVRIILIDKNENYLYAPALLGILFNKRSVEQIQRPLKNLRSKGIEFIQDEVIEIDINSKIITTKNDNIQYDYLIVALGAELASEKVSGLSESGYNLYSLNGALQLRDQLADVNKGKIAILISSLPFKCPAAPYEAAFLIDEYYRKKGSRKNISITIYTPEILPMPSAGAENGKAVKKMLAQRNIQFEPEKIVTQIDAETKKLHFLDTGIAGFDLLIYIPPHQAPHCIRNSQLANESGWITVDKHKLTTQFNDVYAIGDCTQIKLSSGKLLPKAGVFAHFEAEIVANNIALEVENKEPTHRYTGQASCFLDIGFGKAGFASGNFYAEPQPDVVLRRPSLLWKWAKELFEKYWLWKWFK